MAQEKAKMQQAFQFMLQDNAEKLDKKDFKGVYARMDKIDRTVANLDLEI